MYIYIYVSDKIGQLHIFFRYIFGSVPRQSTHQDTCQSTHLCREKNVCLEHLPFFSSKIGKANAVKGLCCSGAATLRPQTTGTWLRSSRGRSAGGRFQLPRDTISLAAHQIVTALASRAKVLLVHAKACSRTLKRCLRKWSAKGCFAAQKLGAGERDM